MHSNRLGSCLWIDSQRDGRDESGGIRFCLEPAESQHPRSAMLVFKDIIFVLRREMDILMFGVWL